MIDKHSAQAFGWGGRWVLGSRHSIQSCLALNLLNSNWHSLASSAHRTGNNTNRFAWPTALLPTETETLGPQKLREYRKAVTLWTSPAHFRCSHSYRQGCSVECSREISNQSCPFSSKCYHKFMLPNLFHFVWLHAIYRYSTDHSRVFHLEDHGICRASCRGRVPAYRCLGLISNV